jgi:glycine cleavage system pyridoxal-binding protein P
MYGQKCKILFLALVPMTQLTPYSKQRKKPMKDTILQNMNENQSKNKGCMGKSVKVFLCTGYLNQLTPSSIKRKNTMQGIFLPNMKYICL